MLTVQQNFNKWKKGVIVSLLTIFSTSVAFADIQSYTTVNYSGNSYIYDRTNPSSRSSSYNLTNGSYTKDNVNNLIDKCEDSSLTNCDSSLNQTTLSTSGDTYYFHNRQSNEYLSAIFTYDSGFSDVTLLEAPKKENTAPVINTSFSDLTINEDNGTTSYDINISDVDMDELNLTIESNNTNILTVTPSWSGELNSADWNQEFNLTTVKDAFGTVEITVTVNDGELNVTKSFEVSISEISDNIVVPYQENGDDVNTSVIFDKNLTDVVIDGTEATINVGGNRVQVRVASSGEVNASVTLANGRTSHVVIDNTQSQTTVDASGNVKTTLGIDEESSVETRLNADGTVTHKVTYRGVVTKATSRIPGATVSIDENGSVETTSEVEKNGFIYKAIVRTNTKGETTTKFIRVNVTTGVQEDLSNTLKDGVSFESGNKPEVIELNDLIYIKVTTPLDNGILVVE